MSLPEDKKGNRIPQPINNGMDFRVQTAFGASDSLIFRFFPTIRTFMGFHASRVNKEPTKTTFNVKSSDYFADAVLLAVENNITAGTSATTFSPNLTCSNAQILTFLRRANGSPESTAENLFTDIKTTDYYYKAALWAAEKGLVSGSTFGTNTDCTRAMTVEYL